LKASLMISFWSVAFSIALAACSTPTAVVIPTKGITIVPTPTTSLVMYQDVANKFELTYSKSDFYIEAHKSPDLAVDFLVNIEDNFRGKNLEEVRVSIAVNRECHFIWGYGATALIESATINGISFTRYSARDSATSTNVFETITYQTSHHRNCYEIHTSIREYVLEVFPNLTEYSRSLLDTKLDGLIKTFRFIE